MQKVQGWSELGNTVVTVSGLPSSNKVQGSFPLSTITVYLHGTVTLASIFSDNNITPTPLANPFTANSNGTFAFYVNNGHYDIVLSGAGIPSPLTISDVLVNDSALAVYNALEYGAVGNGTTNDAGALNTLANTTIPATGGTIYFPPGKTFNIGSSMSFPSYVTLLFDTGAALAVGNGVTVIVGGSVSAPEDRIFILSGTGSITSLLKARLSWFGAIAGNSGIDNGPFLLAAINSIGGASGELRIAQGLYWQATSCVLSAITLNNARVVCEGSVEFIWNGATSTALAMLYAPISTTVSFNNNVFNQIHFNANGQAGYCLRISGDNTLLGNGGSNRFNDSIFEGATVENVLIGSITEPYDNDVNASANLFDHCEFYNALYNVKINALNAENNKFRDCIFGSNISGVVLQHVRVVWGLNTVIENPDFGTMQNTSNANCTCVYAITPVSCTNVYMEESRLAIVADGAHYVDASYIFKHVNAIDGRSDANLQNAYFYIGNGTLVLEDIGVNCTGVLCPTRLVYCYGPRQRFFNVQGIVILQEGTNADYLYSRTIDGVRCGGYASLTNNWNFSKWISSVAPPTGDTPAVWTQLIGSGGTMLVQATGTGALFNNFRVKIVTTVAPSTLVSGLQATVDHNGFLTVIFSGSVDALTTIPQIFVNGVSLTTTTQFGQGGNLSSLRFVAWASVDLTGITNGSVLIQLGIQKNLTGTMWIDTITTLPCAVSPGCQPGLILAAPESRAPASAFAAASPGVAGAFTNWGQGDIVWNSAAASGGPPGWVCTVAGSPGTWKAMANLA